MNELVAKWETMLAYEEKWAGAARELHLPLHADVHAAKASVIKEVLEDLKRVKAKEGEHK